MVTGTVRTKLCLLSMLTVEAPRKYQNVSPPSQANFPDNHSLTGKVQDDFERRERRIRLVEIWTSSHIEMPNPRI